MRVTQAIIIMLLFFLCRRNDFISVVRNAARTALENMNIPEAKEVLQVTKVLEDEIESLAGNQAAVWTKKLFTDTILAFILCCKTAKKIV